MKNIYQMIKPFSEQVVALEILLDKPTSDTLPEGVEGQFLIPKVELIAPTYNEAVIRVLEAIKSTQSLYSWREEQLDETYLRQSARKKEMIAMCPVYESDARFILLSAQLGKRWKGKSVEYVRKNFVKNEFGLGAYEVGCILLTHPELLQRYQDLWIDCAGDEYAPAADGEFVSAPVFDWDDDGLWFDSCGVDIAGGCCGSASAFVP